MSAQGLHGLLSLGHPVFDTMGRWWEIEKEDVHLVVGPLHLIHEIQTGVHDEWVHVSCFLAKACDAITALLGGAEFELEEGLVVGVYDAEIV